MNICTPGNCICDAAEWPGDTNCMGEVVGEAPSYTLDPDYDPRYYWSTEHNVVFSVNNPREMVEGIDYFLTPDDVLRHQRDTTVKTLLDQGLLTREQAIELNGLRPVTDSPRNPEPKPPGPKGQRRRTFKMKPKRGS